MEILKQKILETVKPNTPAKGVSVLEYKELVHDNIWTDAINAAIKETGSVYIPKMDGDIYLDGSIELKSGQSITVDPGQRLIMIDGTGLCMVRNTNIKPGTWASVKLDNPDTGITVDGGIWCAPGEVSLSDFKENPTQGSYAIMIFSNVTDLTVRNVVYEDSISYALQICNAERFFVDNVTFVNYKRDGVHVNGPANYGIIGELKGRNMGDDMVALNAWDWDTSAMTFGTIENLYIHDIHSEHNELRLLPGQKIYENERLECEIRNIVYEHVQGIYTFKLYNQPNISNAEIGKNDVSGDVGSIYNVYFNDVDFNNIVSGGFHGLMVGGLFDVCANCHDLYFNNIRVYMTEKEFADTGLALVKVGPLSNVWKNGSENPEDWGEVFSPDDICEVTDIYFKDVTFAGKPACDKALLAKAIHLTINEDYPHTVPKGGTGYGILGKVNID